MSKWATDGYFPTNGEQMSNKMGDWAPTSFARSTVITVTIHVIRVFMRIYMYMYIYIYIYIYIYLFIDVYI